MSKLHLPVGESENHGLIRYEFDNGYCVLDFVDALDSAYQMVNDPDGHLVACAREELMDPFSTRVEATRRVTEDGELPNAEALGYVLVALGLK